MQGSAMIVLWFMLFTVIVISRRMHQTSVFVGVCVIGDVVDC